MFVLSRLLPVAPSAKTPRFRSLLVAFGFVAFVLRSEQVELLEVLCFFILGEFVELFGVEGIGVATIPVDTKQFHELTEEEKAEYLE